MLHWKIVLTLVIFDHPSLRINTLKWFRILFISITVVCQKFVRLWFRIAVYGLSRGSGLGRLCSNHVGATAPMVEHYFPPPPPLTHHHRIFLDNYLTSPEFHVPFLRVFLFDFPFSFSLQICIFVFPFL